MKRETHEVAEKTLDEITEFLKDETLTEEVKTGNGKACGEISRCNS